MKHFNYYLYVAFQFCWVFWIAAASARAAAAATAACGCCRSCCGRLQLCWRSLCSEPQTRLRDMCVVLQCWVQLCLRTHGSLFAWVLCCVACSCLQLLAAGIFFLGRQLKAFAFPFENRPPSAFERLQLWPDITKGRIGCVGWSNRMWSRTQVVTRAMGVLFFKGVRWCTYQEGNGGVSILFWPTDFGEPERCKALA